MSVYPALRPESLTRAISFLILVEGFMNIITLHLFFSNISGSKDEDFRKIDIYCLFGHTQDSPGMIRS